METDKKSILFGYKKKGVFMSKIILDKEEYCEILEKLNIIEHILIHGVELASQNIDTCVEKNNLEELKVQSLCIYKNSQKVRNTCKDIREILQL
jgi:hypothetical protein